MVVKGTTPVNAIAPVTNGAEATIAATIPYIVSLTLEGTSDMLFHRYNVESVAEKGKAAKGSATKKTDDVNSYIWRNEKGNLCVPGEYLRGAIVNAAKFRQDPRSPRKSAMDLYKAGVVSLTMLADLGIKDWDYIDRRRVMVQRSAITRERPAVKAGWRADFQLAVQLPEYIDPLSLHEVIAMAGKLTALGDFRPTYGRFAIVKYDYE